MASVELEVDGGGEGSKTKEMSEIRMREKSSNYNNNNTKKKDKNGSYRNYIPKLGFGCLRTEFDKDGNFDMEVVDGAGQRRNPTHLIIMVNGLIGR
jgi:hypothetical protein